MLPLCCLLAISCLLHCSVFKVQILTFFQGQIEMLTRLSKHFNPNLKRSGGDKRNRTAGLLLARQALSQLSYTPTSRKIQVVGPSGLEPPTSRLSVVRSSQLSYGPVRFAALQRAPSKLNNVTTLRSTITDLGHCSKLSSAEFSLERR